MLCPSLVDRGGHEFEYTSLIASAALAQGIAPRTLIPRSASIELDLPGKTERFLPLYGYARFKIARLCQASYRVLIYLIGFVRFGSPGTLWFVHSSTHSELGIIALAWIFSSTREQKLTLFLRQEIPSRKKFLLAFLSRAARYGISFVSDGDELAEIMGRKLHTPVTLVPIPIHPPLVRRETSLVCGYFGAKRPSKGFYKLATLITSLRAVAPKIRFVIQAYEHRDDSGDDRIDAQLEALKKMPDVRLIEKILSEEDFQRELSACSIVLLPYESATYQTATSGIFVQAVAAQAVAIVTKGTWMAKQARKHKLNRIVLLPNAPSPEEASDAAKQAQAFVNAPPQTNEDEKEWIAAQSGENVMKLLTAI